MTGHVTAPAAALADQLPGWASLVRAPNPGPMTLEGTNTWVLRAPGAAAAVVIDPGPLDAGHLAAIAQRGPISLILVTHGHRDHVEGVDELARMVSAPVWGLVDGYRSEGNSPLDGDGLIVSGGLEIRPIVTPGHTADSVCFLVEGGGAESGGAVDGGGGAASGGERAVFTGDTILGRGTTVVAWPDGDLGDYLASLMALSEYDAIPALPGHGPPLSDCAAAARFYLAHRRARLDQVRQAVAEGAADAAEVVARVYADVDRSLWPAAEWSVRAQLAHLERETRESSPGVGGLD
jgi:glyoxylase-like metal-dependent hydrolase (beta-lactamase superfamily II)